MLPSKKIDISIIVPIFNVAAYLPLLLDSLINQTLKSIEIIAINDGSTDNSLDIASQYAAKDARIVLINQTNHGLSITRNNGLKLAQGRYIAFADSDDWLAPNALETWLRYADDASLDMVIGNGFYFSKHPNEASTIQPILNHQAWGMVQSGPEWIARSVALQEWPHFVWLQLIRKDYLDQIKANFTEHIVHEDILWTSQVAISAKRIGFVETPFYGYRRNSASITANPSEKAVYHRASSYITIISALVSIANNQSHHARLKQALLLQANTEGGHFLGLMRKKINNKILRSTLAKQFLSLGLAKWMFKGATNHHALWRALRLRILLYKWCKQTNHLAKTHSDK